MPVHRASATTQDRQTTSAMARTVAQRGQDQPRLAQLTAEQRSQERLEAAQVH